MDVNDTEIKRGARLTGEARDRVTKLVVSLYAGGNSMRAVRDQLDTVYHIDRSYGFVHRALTQAGVKVRGRGGNNRRRGTATP